jgi:hypothetical protein
MTQTSPISNRTFALGAALLIITAAVLVFCTGCKTTTSNEQNIQLAATIARTAATAGTIYDLRAHPEHRVGLEAGVLALDMLIKDENYDPAALTDALSKLPIQVFQGQDGALIVTGIVSVFDLFTSTQFDVQSRPATKAMLTAIRDGVKAGLAATANRAWKPTVKPNYTIEPVRVIAI